MGAPRSGTLLMRRLGAGVTESCTGVPDPLRETRTFGFRILSGELASFCASSAVVSALSFMGCGISSSDESPMSMFCIMGAFAAKPWLWPSTLSGESLRERAFDCERMRPRLLYEPIGVGEAVAMVNRGGASVAIAALWATASCSGAWIDSG